MLPTPLWLSVLALSVRSGRRRDALTTVSALRRISRTFKCIIDVEGNKDLVPLEQDDASLELQAVRYGTLWGVAFAHRFRLNLCDRRLHTSFRQIFSWTREQCQIAMEHRSTHAAACQRRQELCSPHASVAFFGERSTRKTAVLAGLAGLRWGYGDEFDSEDNDMTDGCADADADADSAALSALADAEALFDRSYSYCCPHGTKNILLTLIDVPSTLQLDILVGGVRPRPLSSSVDLCVVCVAADDSEGLAAAKGHWLPLLDAFVGAPIIRLLTRANRIIDFDMPWSRGLPFIQWTLGKEFHHREYYRSCAETLDDIIWSLIDGGLATLFQGVDDDDDEEEELLMRIVRILRPDAVLGG